MRCAGYVSLQERRACSPKGFLSFNENVASREERRQRFRELGGIEDSSLLGNQCDLTPQEWRTEKPSDTLAVVIHESVEADFTIALSIKRRDIVEGQHISLWSVATIQV